MCRQILMQLSKTKLSGNPHGDFESLRACSRTDGRTSILIRHECEETKRGNVRNTDARSRNHCCRGKAISITYLCVYARVGASACVWVRRCTGVCARASARVYSLSHAASEGHALYHLLWPLASLHFSTLSNK